MSIGNLKDSGNQGNNLPWQWKVLQGLQAILDEVAEPLTCLEDSVTICNENIDTLTFTDIPLVGESLNVNIANTIPLEVIITEADDSILIYGNDGSTNRKIKTDTAGELQVDVLTMPATYLEDSAHASGNLGAFVMGVRNDSNTAMTSANGDYSPVAVNSAGAVAIQDGGNSITIDATSLPLPTGAATAALQTQPGVDIGDVTVNNGSGAAAVNIQDGNNSITTDTLQLPTTIGQTNMAGSVSVTLANNQLGIARTPTFLRPLGSNGSTSALAFSASFASVGTANAIVGGINLKPGETLNFDAGAINNTLGAITYNTLTNAGAELIIITLT